MCCVDDESSDVDSGTKAYLTEISKERQTKILEKALDWFPEHYETKELLDILHEHLDMTDSEIDYFGFDFSDLTDEEDDTFSIIHFHDSDDDYCITTSNPYDLYDVAEIYYKYLQDDVGKVTLDSLAHRVDNSNLIDERLYPILYQSAYKDKKLQI